MKDEDRKYELVINSSINILKIFTLMTFFIDSFVIFFNYLHRLNKIWNICFLIPMNIIAFSSFILLIISFWRVCKVKSDNIDKIISRKSGLVFSACITYIVFMVMFFMYILLSMVLFC